LCGRRTVAFALLLLPATPLAAACGADPFTLSAAGPFAYPPPSSLNPSLERVAVVVTIASRSGDDLLVTPADFAVRDGERRLYVANPAATVADAGLVVRVPELRGALPLPAVTLRQDDVLTGFVVFDLPAGARPVELIWRQTDGDFTARLDAR
jgi:hypothetical protein